MADIFLSYAREDEARAAAVASALTDLGWSIFWDRRIRAGSSWDEVIERELRACKCVVVLWSATSVSSRWVKTEARFALQRDILVPVRLDASDLPIEFDSVEAAQLQTWSGRTNDPEFLVLSDGIAQHVKPRRREPAPLPVAATSATKTQEPSTLSAARSSPNSSSRGRRTATPTVVKRGRAAPEASRSRRLWIEMAAAAAAVVMTVWIVLPGRSPSDDTKAVPPVRIPLARSQDQPPVTSPTQDAGTLTLRRGGVSAPSNPARRGGSLPLGQVPQRGNDSSAEASVDNRGTTQLGISRAEGVLGLNRALLGLPNDDLWGFVFIPAGTVTMGSDKKVDPQAQSDELPQHSVALPAYFVGKYEVTVGQYKWCVRDHGCAPQDKRALEGANDLPVRWISWLEALAYCDWLDKKLKSLIAVPGPLADALAGGRDGARYGIRLPSEAEWERAARGTNARLYPWGDSIDATKANYTVTSPTGKRNVVAVGSFPAGRTTEGVYDLGGNVSEWTRSDKKSYPYVAADGRERRDAGPLRAVRGGSFRSFWMWLRAAYRNLAGIEVRDDSIGFRLVFSRLADQN